MTSLILYYIMNKSEKINIFLFRKKCYNADNEVDLCGLLKLIYHKLIINIVIMTIQLIIKDNKYLCLDGHKRLSVLQDILEKNPQYKRGSQVYVLIKNNDNIRSNDCWRGRNSH